jgi:uncharacterized protein YutE (UPF0331/DUF86 family)
MDREVIEQKLESLRRCLQRVAEKCPPDPATLGRDPDLQDIVTLNLTRAVQLCVDLGAHLIADLDVLPPDTGPNLRCAGPCRSHPRTSGPTTQEGSGLSEYCRASL